GGVLNLHDLEVRVLGGEGFGLLPVGGAFAQADDDVDAALGQVLGMGVALRAEADDRDGLAVKQAEVAVGIVVLVDSHGKSSFLGFDCMIEKIMGKRCWICAQSAK